MMTLLLKLMPLGIVATGVAKSTDKIEPVLQYVRTIVVQYEVNQISKLIYMDSIDEENLPEQPNFAQYIRRQMEVKENSEGLVRDPSKDYWKNDYQLFYKDDKAIVVSMGPDAKLGTPDDIVSKVKLQNR